MITDSRSAGLSALLGSPSGRLALRFRNSNHAGEVIALSGGKCTIGAGHACTLRLEHKQFARLECLILRGGQRTVVRSWQGQARINDRPVVDGTLKAGDRLGIGSLEWDVVFDGEGSDSEAGGSSIEGAKPDPSSVSEEKHKLDAERAELEGIRQQLALDRARLNAETTARRAERESWEAERAAWQKARTAAEAELDEQKQYIAEQAEALTIQSNGLSQENAAAIRSRLEIDADRRSLALSRQLLDDAQRSLDEKLKAIEQLESEWETRRSALGGAQRNWHEA